MAFIQRIKECNKFNKLNFFKFYINNFHLGYIKKKNINLIKEFPNILKLKNNKVYLDKKFNNFQKRSNAINKIFKFLCNNKIIKSNHREYFPIFNSFKRKPLLKVQRLLGPFFGFQFFGVHLNGFFKENEKYFMWIGKRSSKGNFPNDLDQIAAGGLPYGVGIKENLIKESFEEAGIQKKLSSKSKYVGTVSYGVETKIGFSRYILFCYDLQLPKSFIPNNHDGEIVKFYIWPIEKILNIIKKTRKFKFDCAMVIIHFTLRRKIINSKKLSHLLNVNKDIKILSGHKAD